MDIVRRSNVNYKLPAQTLCFAVNYSVR